MSNFGDGTVLRLSACNGSYSYAHGISQGHVEMVKHIPTINSVIGIIAGAYATMQSQQTETVNENGWPVGSQYDNRRISVYVGGAEQISVTAAGGETVIEEGEALYKVHADGSEEQIGISCILGGSYDKKYYLHNGEYNFYKSASSAGAETVSFRIEYYNDGYLEKTITFENLICSMLALSVKDYTVQEAECFVDGASEAILPTSVQ
jgi:hypothetical protein